MTERYVIRPLYLEDVPQLVKMRPGFVSDSVLKVEKTGSGFKVGWRLVEVQLEKPFDKAHGYDFDATERENIRKRLTEETSLEEVIEDRQTGRIVGVLDVVKEDWRRVGWVWNIMLDKDIRGRGFGRQLMERAIAWARHHRLRAVMLETQTNNVPACKFYAHIGFQLVGINDAFYSNRDLERDEVALFWSFPL